MFSTRVANYLPVPEEPRNRKTRGCFLSTQRYSLLRSTETRNVIHLFTSIVITTCDLASNGKSIQKDIWQKDLNPWRYWQEPRRKVSIADICFYLTTQCQFTTLEISARNRWRIFKILQLTIIGSFLQFNFIKTFKLLLSEPSMFHR